MRALAVMSLLALPLAAAAKDNPDESFFHKAAQAGHAEIQAGQIAQRKATSPTVKAFAETMVKEHTAANMRLGTIAGAKGVPLPTGPSRAQKAMNNETKKKSGDVFDRDYVEDQIKSHEETIELLQKEIAEGQDADAKAFAAETLPMVKAHLERIKQVGEAMARR